MEDGTLLSPERPALALDSSLLYRALRGTALSTEAEAATEPEHAAACEWSEAVSGKFLRDDVGGQPEASTKTLAAAQAWCCSTVGCGGVTFQQDSYQARHEKEPHACDQNCAAMKSWVKNPAAPPPPPAPPRKLARSAPNGEVWSTYSTVGALTYRHVLVPLLREPYPLALEELAQNDGQGDHSLETVVVDNAEDAKPTTATVLKGPLALPTCDRTDFKLFHTVPMLPNGWGLVGETAKWIPISTARIRSVSYSTASDSEDSAAAPVTVQLSGVVNETIAFGYDRHAATCLLLAAQ